MEYDLTLAQKAYKLAEKWDSARQSEISELDFKETDLKDFSAGQTGSQKSHINALTHGSVVSSRPISETYTNLKEPPMPKSDSGSTKWLSPIHPPAQRKHSP
jgi:hypothetical protein